MLETRSHAKEAGRLGKNCHQKEKKPPKTPFIQTKKQAKKSLKKVCLVRSIFTENWKNLTG